MGKLQEILQKTMLVTAVTILGKRAREGTTWGPDYHPCKKGHGEENGTWKPETQKLVVRSAWQQLWLLVEDQPACGINTMTSLSFFLLISCQCSSLTKPIRKPVGKGAIIKHKCSPRAESRVVERGYLQGQMKDTVHEERGEKNFPQYIGKNIYFQSLDCIKIFSYVRKFSIKQNSKSLFEDLCRNLIKPICSM